MQFWDQHKTITDYYELLASRVCARYALTQMEYDILMFLHGNPQHNTASNKKRIEITLTERSAPIIDAGTQVQAQFSKDVLSGLTQEEKDICISIFCRIHDNADECMRKYKEDQK